MIFATVGTQLPFDRLIHTVDKWSIKQHVSDCFAQIGKKGEAPKNLTSVATLNPLQFANKVANCKAIVSHAGMGTILTALQYGKPIIVMPRLALYGEHRNDHQLATIANLEGHAGIHVAHDEGELVELLDEIHSLKAGAELSCSAEPELIQAISSFIGTGVERAFHV
ncbi:MAG: hypothetical protein JKY60_01215 [Kordiimonadaceae bacterium]|nr:hypothetical protein [Kordiimonadaceae bacterium]